ncbi:putative AMP-binding enzyme [Delitschia confertaspora ATCC 74209]|uniref:AMP-binding enzyme n=1 Tax=Delitschia confertaspora ATCC 74209 TaxID=1513339 RepID=A0A9P4JQI8_9PLEO|nr:putative AMP-binding enzyme [Delitschia confertaspora ATCC 74209]
MSSLEKPGSRLLVSLIDHYALTDPSRVWAALPIDENDLSKGFRDITYKQFANAIDYTASRLQELLGTASTPFETIAYAGPKDIRYAIIAVATAKMRRKLLVPSPYAAVKAQAHLLNESGCRSFLYGGGAPFRAVAESVISESENGIGLVKVPELKEILEAESVTPVPFTRTWEEAKDEPWMIFHTSGTTGLPKLITYTHDMMTSLDVAELMPDAHEETMSRHFEKSRWYTPLPSLHFVGMTVALQFTVFLNTVVVVGPAGQGPTKPQDALAVLQYGNVQGIMFPPALIDGLCQSPVGLACLRELDYIYFAGAPLTRSTAEELLGHVTVKPAMGSTEAGAYFIKISDENDWEYYSFREAMGLEFRKRGGGLYEPVFVRKSEYERFQQIFKVYPELNEFPTKDLFAPHPSKPGFWKYIGRTDDMIVFSHGEDLFVSDIEAEIAECPGVSAVLVGGQGKPKPFLLIEWKEDDVDDKTKLEQLWPYVERANKRCSDLVKMNPELVLFASSEKKLARTAKGTVARHESEKLYMEEIDRLY